jgi:site-specific DNA recombinase|nr:recombinase family protein [Nitrosomonas nitrosa]
MRSWIAVSDDYDDPAYSGGNMERPALQRLLADIEAGKIDVVIIYKIDRFTRSLADFSRMVEVFEQHRCRLFR